MTLKADTHHDTTVNMSTAAVARGLPTALRRAVALGWRADRGALLTMAAAQALSAVLAAVALTATTTLVRQALDLLDAHSAGHGLSGPAHAAVPSLLTVCGALTARALADSAARGAAARLAPRAAREADVEVLAAAAAVELAAYEEPGFEDALDAAGNGAEAARDLVQDTQSLVSAAAQIAAAALVLVTLHPLLAVLLIAAAVPRGAAAVRAARIEHATSHAAVADRRLRQLLRNYSTTRTTAAEVRACGMGGFLADRYRQVSDRLERQGLAGAVTALRVQLLGDAASALVLAGTWAALIALIAGDHIAVAAAGTALVALRASNSSLTAAVRSAAGLFRTSLFLDDWARFLADAGRHRTRRGDAIVPPTGPDVITATDVSFTYPGTGTAALSGIELELKRGEVVALVGENGSGKTTLAHLLTGLYLPDTGAITWDGIDLAKADPVSVWANVSMVPQDYTRWPLTARENITLGTPAGAGDAAVHAAAAAAGAADVLRRLPHGLDTSLARSWWGGHDLSGGQWQRLAIARAFHRSDASVLLLDEPTAALDARGEHQVFRRLKALAEGRTAVFITHRLANARVADRVLVLKDGTVVESGTYEDLLARGGLFAELHALQNHEGGSGG